MKDKKELIRGIKFTLFSISAGVIEIVLFEILDNFTNFNYWASYLIALIASVIWNFTLNRELTFKATNNIPIAMIKVGVFYAIFTPVSTILGNYLAEDLGWNSTLVTLLNMLCNFILEFLYDKYVVFRGSIDTKISKKEIIMINNVEVLCHSSIRIAKDKVIYFDPFKIKNNYSDADVIFITHDHYDHYSKQDIDKIIKESTVIVAPVSMKDKLINDGYILDNLFLIEPGKSYNVNDIKFDTISAYNISKKFHPKENGWVGYVVNLDDIKYYVAGDTDVTDESKSISCDVALVPVGGTYTMDYKEAAELVNIIKPKIAIPTHYGEVVGSKQDADSFIKLLDTEIKGEILIKQ